MPSAMPFLPALLFVGGNLSGSYGIAKPPASVVRGLDPRIHVFASRNTWMAGTSPGHAVTYYF